MGFAPCSLIEDDGLFGGDFSRHLQGDRVSLTLYTTSKNMKAA